MQGKRIEHFLSGFFQLALLCTDRRSDDRNLCEAVGGAGAYSGKQSMRLR
jgi:hypothetical protein